MWSDNLFLALLEHIILPQGPLVTRREFGMDDSTHKQKGQEPSKLSSQGQLETMGVLQAQV